MFVDDIDGRRRTIEDYECRVWVRRYSGNRIHLGAMSSKEIRCSWQEIQSRLSGWAHPTLAWDWQGLFNQELLNRGEEPKRWKNPLDDLSTT